MVMRPIRPLTQRRTMKETTRNTPDRLASYLAAAAGIGGLAATAEAAVVQLDVTSISGVNAGLATGESKTASIGSLGSDLGGGFTLYHQVPAEGKYPVRNGLSATGGAMIATGTSATSPTNFAANALIGTDTPFSSGKYKTLFVSGSNVSPDFGPDSFMASRARTATTAGWK